jgi:anaerobic selenocysteine-containing dehydrogenase
MAGTLADRIKRLKRGKSGKGVFAASPYQWREIDSSEEGKRQVLHGICGGCMQRDCATLVHLEDGIVVSIEGNPESPPNYGSLCSRGLAEIMGLYNPYRVKTPLVRTNPEKGLDIDPMWKEVTWDEALSLIADKLRQVREKDPRGLVLCEGFGNRDSLLRMVFSRAYGTPNEVGTHGPLCTIHYASMLVHAAVPEAIADMEHCEYLLSFGRSLGPNFATTGATRRFAQAIERGLKLVVIDPRSSYEASKGEWIPIRPGSDLAFLLAMAHVMMHEGLKYDDKFLKNRTNAPYLIDPEGNYYRDPATSKPMMWDAVADCARIFDDKFQDVALSGAYTVNGVECRTGFDLIKEEFARYTPEWAEPICTVPAATIRRLAREFVDHARIGSTIQIDDFTFPFRPASVNTHRGVNNHRGGTYADLTGKIINMLVGNIEVPGGCVGDGQRGPAMFPDEDGVVAPQYEAKPKPFKFPPDHIDGSEFYPNKHTAPHLTVKAILEPEKYYHDYKVEAWLSIASNPVRKNAQPELVVEALKKIPFIAAVSYHMDEMTILADVVLPEHSTLERSAAIVMVPPHQATGAEVSGLRMAYIRQPVPTVFNSRHVDDIFMDLAERMGFLYGEGGLYDILNKFPDIIIGRDGFYLDGTEQELDINRKYSLEEIYDRQLKSWVHGDGHGLDELNQTGFELHTAPKKEWYLYYFYPDGTSRHPFYFESLKKTGDELRANLRKYNIKFPGVDDEDHVFDLYRPIPHWVENSEFRAPEEYDLWAISWRTPYFSNDASNITGNPWLAEVADRDPFEGEIQMNTATARRKGLEEGDQVVVESRYGRTTGRLHLTELLHPDALGIPGCFGLGTILSNPLSRRGASWNSLPPFDDRTLDAVSAGMESAPRVKVYKEGAPR